MHKDLFLAQSRAQFATNMDTKTTTITFTRLPTFEVFWWPHLAVLGLDTADELISIFCWGFNRKLVVKRFGRKGYEINRKHGTMIMMCVRRLYREVTRKLCNTDNRFGLDLTVGKFSERVDYIKSIEI